MFNDFINAKVINTEEINGAEELFFTFSMKLTQFLQVDFKLYEINMNLEAGM